MMLLSKEEFMKELGVTQKEIDNLIPMTFERFKQIKVGDIVYSVEDWEYFIPVPFKVVYSKWLFSGYDCTKCNGKPFWYKQIVFVRDNQKLYADSAGTNYKSLYIKR